MVVKSLASHPQSYVDEMQSCHAGDVDCKNLVFLLFNMGSTLLHQLAYFSHRHCGSDAQCFFNVGYIKELGDGDCSTFQNQQLLRLSQVCKKFERFLPLRDFVSLFENKSRGLLDHNWINTFKSRKRCYIRPPVSNAR